MADRSGWAFGDRGEWDGELSRYLTILGSAHKQPELYAERGQAERALAASGLAGAAHLNMTVAHVTEVRHPGVTGPRGYAYRITEDTGAPDFYTLTVAVKMTGPQRDAYREEYGRQFTVADDVAGRVRESVAEAIGEARSCYWLREFTSYSVNGPQ